MPNLAIVDYVITGNDEHIDYIYGLMKDLEEMKESLIENAYGKNWLGNLIAKLGGNPMTIDCRGEWVYLSREDYGLVITMETAWGELFEVRNYLEGIFPDLKIYYNSVTDYTWWTNDREGLFYDERYYLYTEEHGSGYYKNISELIVEIESVTGIRGLKTLEDCKRVLSQHCVLKEQEDENYEAYLGEYVVSD